MSIPSHRHQYEPMHFLFYAAIVHGLRVAWNESKVHLLRSGTHITLCETQEELTRPDVKLTTENLCRSCASEWYEFFVFRKYDSEVDTPLKHHAIDDVLAEINLNIDSLEKNGNKDTKAYKVNLSLRTAVKALENIMSPSALSETPVVRKPEASDALEAVIEMAKNAKTEEEKQTLHDFLNDLEMVLWG